MSVATLSVDPGGALAYNLTHICTPHTRRAPVTRSSRIRHASVTHPSLTRHAFVRHLSRTRHAQVTHPSHPSRIRRTLKLCKTLRHSDVDRIGLRETGEGRPLIGEGRPLIDEGRPLIDEGRPLIGEGRPLIGEGRPLIDEGRPLISSTILKQFLFTLKSNDNSSLERSIRSWLQSELS